MSQTETVNVLISVLGGDGGERLIDWLIKAARDSRWLIQTSHLTPATQAIQPILYYAELFPRKQAPVMTPAMGLHPMPGRIDIAVSSEIAEAGRMLKNGFITPGRTTVISATHRIRSLAEKNKSDLDTEVIRALIEKYSKRTLCHDMQALARQHDVHLDVVLFGVLAGSQVLTFDKEYCARIVDETDEADLVGRNAAAFCDGYALAAGEIAPVEEPPLQTSHLPRPPAETFELPMTAQSTHGRALLGKIKGSFPTELHLTVYQGLVRTVAYQDFVYGDDYLDKLVDILRLDTPDKGYRLTRTVAHHLTLWMCFEDLLRIIELKTRPSRMAEIRSAVGADKNQVMQVTDYIHPTLEEVCACLPAFLSRFLLAFGFTKRLARFLFCGEKKLHLHKTSVQFFLRFIVFLKYFRRRSAGYQHEQGLIQGWLTAIKHGVKSDYEIAVTLAEAACLVQGYGRTRARTTRQVAIIANKVQSEKAVKPADLQALIQAATRDDKDLAFNQCMADIDTRQEVAFD